MTVLALLELWWVVPVLACAGTAGVLLVRRSGADRRLGYVAANLELREAIKTAKVKQQLVRVARTDIARVAAEQTTIRGSIEGVMDARRALQVAQREAKAAAATVRHLRACVASERAAIPARSEPTPLARLLAEHDSILVRWMQYETDPAKQIEYPAMSDARVPETAAFLAALESAQRSRPAGSSASPQEYIGYRRAVRQLQEAFGAAERAAKKAAGEQPELPAEPWPATAQQIWTLSADVVDRAVAAAATAITAWTSRLQR